MQQKKEPSGRRRNRILLFLLVLLALAFLVLILIQPDLSGRDTAGEAGQPVKQEAETKQERGAKGEEPGAQKDPAGQEEQPARRDRETEYLQVDYSWSYGKGTWTYQLKIPCAAYEYYKTVDRKNIRDYSYYVTNSSDDEYLAALAAKFKEAAKKEGYSDLDMVKNLIFFVQNLNYVDDKVGTGYDEYPKFPLETLADEGGDCEDSAILLAALLRELNYGTVLVQFSNHMGVGVRGEPSIPGSYFEVEGIRYYYVETTSPGWGIGDLPEQLKDQPAKILPLQ